MHAIVMCVCVHVCFNDARHVRLYHHKSMPSRRARSEPDSGSGLPRACLRVRSVGQGRMSQIHNNSLHPALSKACPERGGIQSSHHAGKHGLMKGCTHTHTHCSSSVTLFVQAQEHQLSLDSTQAMGQHKGATRTSPGAYIYLQWATINQPRHYSCLHLGHSKEGLSIHFQVHQCIRQYQEVMYVRTVVQHRGAALADLSHQGGNALLALHLQYAAAGSVLKTTGNQARVGGGACTQLEVGSAAAAPHHRCGSRVQLQEGQLV